MIRAFYDTPASPQNINLWYSTEENCQLCCSQNPSLQHILSSFTAALKQGWYRWHHNPVLHKVAEILEACRPEANKTSPVLSQRWIHFVRQGDQIGC